MNKSAEFYGVEGEEMSGSGRRWVGGGGEEGFDLEWDTALNWNGCKIRLKTEIALFSQAWILFFPI